MATRLDIVNMALSLINQENISDVNEDSIPAQKALLLYPEVLRRLIERYEWSFCSAYSTVEGEQLGDDDNIQLYDNGYRYKYTLINKAVKFGEVIRDKNDCILNTKSRRALDMARPYLPQGSNLYSNTSPLKLKFILLEEDESFYSSNFTWALVYSLAEALTKVLIDSASYQQVMMGQAEKSTLDAIAEDQRKFPTELINC